ncbi:MAG: ATP-dependent 6-phosphofructokinase [Candidatus Bipolaricaulota bacterium]|nr:ATP-dependent 6-phosphofructokinase [Candidatus Bipolaricaulota bacterium]
MDLRITNLGAAKRRSPLALSTVRGDRVCNFVSDDERVLYRVVTGGEPAGVDESFERAGPREHVYFEPKTLRAGIVTCGGLCPGTNTVIRTAVMELTYSYGVSTVYGFRYGFAGLVPGSGYEPIELTPELVDDIHHHGGTILGSSRGPQDVGAMVETLERMGIGLLLVLGGDGTMRGADELYREITHRGLPISVIGVPKTIDNDIHLVEKTFGFETAFSIAIQAIRSAHTEAKGYLNGIGLVRLMGRQSGYIAASAAIAEPDVNLVLVPEIPFSLDGERGLLAWIERRLATRRHAVIVVAEGAGQDLLHEETEAIETDASGNVLLRDVGRFLKKRISDHLTARKVSHSLKYIDPSYMIRSAPANPNDSIFCSSLARDAVHAGMCGKTGMLVGLWNNQFTNVPLREVVGRRNTIDPEGDLWLAVLESTGQPSDWGSSCETRTKGE